MRLLHIIASMDPASGGPCQGIRNSNPEMIRLGVYREVVCLDDPSAPFIGMDSFPVHALGPGIGPWQYSSKLKPWLIDNLHRFEAIVINGLWLYSSFAGWSALRTLKKLAQRGYNTNIPSMFIMPHGMLDPYFQRAPDRKLKALRNWFYWKLVENRVVNDADALLIVTEWSVFRTPDFEQVADLLKSKVIFDGRNLYDLQKMIDLGFYYNSIGRKIIN